MVLSMDYQGIWRGLKLYKAVESGHSGELFLEGLKDVFYLSLT